MSANVAVGLDPADPTARGRLQAWLDETLPDAGELVSMTRIKGGQSNPTFRTECANGTYVLRMRPRGAPKGAHAIDREFRVLDALRGTEVPVPTVYGYCTDDTIAGGEFYAMDFVEGPVIDDFRLLAMDRADRPTAYFSFIRALATVHRVDYEAVGLSTFGRPERYLWRQIQVFGQPFVEDCPPGYEDMAWLANELPKHLPTTRRSSLVHGDVRLGNMIMGPGHSIAAIVDWELATLGDPLCDAAQVIMPFYIPDTPIGRLDAAMAVELGIPSEQELIAAYGEAAHWDELPDLRFYVALNLYRAAGINYGVGQRITSGAALDDVAFQWAATSIPLAAAARRYAEAHLL